MVVRSSSGTSSSSSSSSSRVTVAVAVAVAITVLADSLYRKRVILARLWVLPADVLIDKFIVIFESPCKPKWIERTK